MSLDLRFLNHLIYQSLDRLDVRQNDPYEKGAAKLVLAQEDVTLNQDLMIEANILFARATQKDPKDFRPYFGLANIFYLMRDNHQARFYLQQAQKLNPSLQDELEEIIAFLAQSDNDNLYDQLSAMTQELECGVSIDYEEMYEQLKNLLVKLAKQWTHRSQCFIASHDEGIIFQLFELKSLLENTIQQLEKQILLIDKEIDIDELEMELRPLRWLFNQCEETYRISSLFKVLSQDIRQLNIQMLHSIKQIADCQFQAKELTGIEAILEDYLDQCERISDELDSIQEQEIDIEALEQQYQQMAKHLMILHNQIDEIA